MTAPIAHTLQHDADEPIARLPQSDSRPPGRHQVEDPSLASDRMRALLTIVPQGQVHDAVANILDEANVEEHFADRSMDHGVQNLVGELVFCH